MPDTSNQTNPVPLTNPSFTVRYDQTTAAHTTQFVLCAGDEELWLECSSGLIGNGDGPPALPIHTRLALTWRAAERLHELLGQVLGNHKTRSQTGISSRRVSGRNSAATRRAARLPRFENADV